MIIATAGHVDHGKTLLIRSLTGIDTDRLPEEKRRNLTIDLGFAYLPLEGAETIGFIDVPGHERFVRNMLCGVAGIDAVLLIVAADDGWMPQTEEHAAILDLLAVTGGAVALTKIDRVPEERVAEVEEEIEIGLAGTSLEAVPVFPVSAVTGHGMASLKAHLTAMGRTLPLREPAGNFRLAIDRSFEVVGAGLVVTGTVFSGEVATNDILRVLDADMAVRVREIHAQNNRSGSGRAGQRCALNLAGPGLDKARIHRGDWVVAGNVPAPSCKIDTRLNVLRSERRALSHWTPVHVHLGAAETTGRVAVLGRQAIEPGEAALAQLVLDRPIGAVHGDGLIIRDQSARRTLGGGHVIDLFPPTRGRARPARIAFLEAMSVRDPEAALATLLQEADNGLDLGRFASSRNITLAEMEVLRSRVSMKTINMRGREIGFSEERWRRIRQLVVDRLEAWHRKSPDTVGPGENRILSGTGIRLPPEAAVEIAVELVKEGAIVKEGLGVRLPTHRPVLQGADAATWNRIRSLLVDAGLRPPPLSEIAGEIEGEPRRVESLLVRAGRQGLVVRVARNRFFLPETLRRLGEIAENVARDAEGGLVTAARFRDVSGIGRNLTIEVLEFFDKVKFTRRRGDGHEIMRSAVEAFGQGQI